MSAPTTETAEASPTEASTQTAAETETPASETAAEQTTTPTAEAPSESKGETAAGVDSYLAEKAKLLPKLKVAPPAEAAEPETETTEETPAPTEEVTATAPETEPEPETAESKRIRLSGLPDGHLVAAANEIARAEKISFSDAWDRVAPKKPEPTAQQVEETTPQLRTRAEVEADIQKARQDRKAAAVAADALEAGAATKMVETEELLESLRDELAAVEYSEQVAAEETDTAERTEFENIVNESKDNAVRDFPEAADPDSAFSKRMIEIADAFEADPNPQIQAFAYDPDSPYVIATMVAKEMGILPNHLRKTPSTNGTKPSTPAATKPALVNQRAVGRPVQPAASPASGAARTTQGNVEDPLGLDKIRSPHDYHKLKARLTGQRV